MCGGSGMQFDTTINELAHLSGVRSASTAEPVLRVNALDEWREPRVAESHALRAMDGRVDVTRFARRGRRHLHGAGDPRRLRRLPDAGDRQEREVAPTDGSWIYANLGALLMHRGHRVRLERGSRVLGRHHRAHDGRVGLRSRRAWPRSSGRTRYPKKKDRPRPRDEKQHGARTRSSIDLVPPTLPPRAPGMDERGLAGRRTGIERAGVGARRTGRSASCGLRQHRR